MATDRSASRYQGLLIPDPRITVDNITEHGAGNTDSDFSEDGPRPGVPIPQQNTDMLLQATGTMAAGALLEVYTQRAGHPGRDGAGFLWRDNSDGSDPTRNGWDPYSIVTAWEGLNSSTSDTDDARLAVLRLASGKVVVAGEQASTGTIQEFHIYDPTTALWTKESLSQTWAGEQEGPAMLQLPSGRVLWFGTAIFEATQVNVAFTDDEFDTWQVASLRALRTPCSGSILGIAAAYSAGEVALWLVWDDSSGDRTISQYASDDLGLTFTQVIDDWNVTIQDEWPLSPTAIAADGGGFLLGMARGGGPFDSAVYRFSSAYSEPDSVVSIVGLLPTAPFGDDTPLTMWRDEAGLVYVICQRTAQAEAALYVSGDDGRTFSTHTIARGLDIFGAGAAPTWKKFGAASTAGRTILATRWDAAGTAHDPASIGAIHLGGYGSHTAPLSDVGTEFSNTDGIGYGDQFGGSGEGFVWMPIEKPSTAGWTETAGGGSVSFVSETRGSSLVPGLATVFQTDSTSGGVSYARALVAPSQVFATFAVTLAKPSGSTTADDTVVKVRISDGSSNSYEAKYRFADTGWTLVDSAGPTDLGTVSEQVSAASFSLMYHRIAITLPESGAIKVQTWYARAAHVLDWTEGPSGTLTDQGTPTTSAIEFGHFNGAQSDVATWYLMGICGWGDKWSPNFTGDIGDDWTTPEDLHPRNVPGLAHPLLLDGDTRIAAIDGPTVIAEEWHISTDSEHPIAHAVETPSPRVAWESEDESAQVIVWDLHNLSGATASSLLNSSVAVALLGCNFQTAILERWDGAVWQTVISLDAATGYTGLKFTRSGNTVTVNTAAASTAGRYLSFDDVRGAVWRDTTNSKSREILTQTEGAWTDDTTKRPRLLLDGVDGTEAASGDCDLWFRDMVGIAHEVTATPRYIRLRIPASQGTISGKYQIGQIVIGSLLIFGHQPSRGYTARTEARIDVTDYDDGSTRASRLGPPVRSLELSWDEGVDASQPQAADAVPDYVAGTAGGLPVATRSDIARTLEGALRDAASADVPVVYIGRIPTNSATPDTLNNPRQFLYGRASGEYRREHVTGDETVSEVDRIAKITIAEVV